MPIIGGSRLLKAWIGDYDFAVDGGAAGTITLRSNDGALPNGSYIVSSVIDVLTLLTSGGAATVAVNSNAAGDILAAAAVSGAPWSTTGLKSGIPVGSGATSVKLTADRSPAITIATAALTAGKFRLVLLFE